MPKLSISIRTQPFTDLRNIVSWNTMPDGIVKNESIQEVKDGVLEYEIPTNFTGTEMSIISVGEYPNRNLSMSVYYVDDSGNKCSLGNAGTWSVNDNSVDGNTAQI
ncbi:MAG: hypothetical protein V8S58_16125 [Lachnospiraceae bacterium]